MEGYIPILAEKDIAVIKYNTPGYDSFEVMPQLGALKIFLMGVPTVKGTIDIKFETGIVSLILKALVPEGTTASTGIPI